MFWTIVGAILFVFVGLPLIIGFLLHLIQALLESLDRETAFNPGAHKMIELTPGQKEAIKKRSRKIRRFLLGAGVAVVCFFCAVLIIEELF